MKTFQQENNDLTNSFLGHTFLKSWKNNLEHFKRIEIYLGTDCDLECKYCYLSKHGEKLYPKKIQDYNTIINNLKLLLDWLIKNKYSPYIEFFSGEPFSQELGFKSLEIILDKFKKVKCKPSTIRVPTNYTFLLSDKKTKRVERLIRYSRKIGIPISLSASFDGKYCEKNRPFKGLQKKRDDKYYNRCFSFNKKWGFGFHPMICSELIENWRKNFLWFQKNYKKFKIPFYSMYLLEVRDKEWSKVQIKEFVKFIEFLIKWTYNNQCKKNADLFVDFLFKKRGYNILRSPISNVGRGLACSIQSTLFIRIGDLSIVPCHRTSYDPFLLGKFKVKNNKIIGIESNNPELMIGLFSFEGKNAPICENCLLKHICTKGCLGSQFETTGDLFSPIPTVCQLEHAKIYAMIKTYKKLKIYKKIFQRINKEQKKSLDFFEKTIDKKYAQIKH